MTHRRKTAPVRRFTASGFTLLEIIIAVAIFGVIMAIIFPVMSQFLEIRERVEERQLALRSWQKTFLFLANDLRFASNRLPKDDFGDRADSTLQVNDEVLLRLTGVYPDLQMEGLPVPRRVEWRLEDEALFRIQYPVADPDADTPFYRQKLLEGVTYIDVQTVVIDDGNETRDSRWEEQSRLPDAIEIELELEDGTLLERRFALQGTDTLAAVAVSNEAQQAGDSGAAPQTQTQPQGGGL